MRWEALRRFKASPGDRTSTGQQSNAAQVTFTAGATGGMLAPVNLSRALLLGVGKPPYGVPPVPERATTVISGQMTAVALAGTFAA